MVLDMVSQASDSAVTVAIVYFAVGFAKYMLGGAMFIFTVVVIKRAVVHIVALTTGLRRIATAAGFSNWSDLVEDDIDEICKKLHKDK